MTRSSEIREARPLAKDGPNLSDTTAEAILGDTSDIWAELARCPVESRRWAGLAYYAGGIDKLIEIENDFKQAGSLAASIAKSGVWPLRRMADIRAARETPIDLCGSPRCTPVPRCSACVRAMAVLRRGGDYIGRAS